MTQFEKQVIEKLCVIADHLENTELCRAPKNIERADGAQAKTPSSAPGSAYADVFTDSRDGEKYPVKKLADGKVWLMEDLRFRVEGATWNEEYNCYMYTWEQAKKAIPEGFHLPTAKESHDLCFALGYLEKSDEEVAKRLMDECGFAPSGLCYGSGALSYQGANGYYWSSMQGDANNAYYLNFNSSGVNPALNTNKNYGVAVRCIKN